MLAFGLAILTLGLPTAPTLVVAPLPSGATEVAFDHIGSVDRFTLAVPPSSHRAASRCAHGTTAAPADSWSMAGSHSAPAAASSYAATAVHSAASASGATVAFSSPG